MNLWRGWPLWGKALFSALLLYSLLLCCVSLSVFVQSAMHGWNLKIVDIAMQLLMMFFPPLLLLGLWRPRLASILLITCAVADLMLLLSMSNRTGDGTGTMLIGSILFLGIPMLGAAILLRRLSAQTI
jgi:hypothetical protein